MAIRKFKFKGKHKNFKPKYMFFNHIFVKKTNNFKLFFLIEQNS
jgi:hypothetical protein